MDESASPQVGQRANGSLAMHVPLLRAFDILLSGCALIALSPLLLLVMAVLRFTGEGEIFYTQARVGRGGRLFPLLKFATMLRNSPNMGTGVLTLRNDPRILPVGRFLRRTKINELPQLWNVLRGDMSMIGPRPQAPPHFDVFSAAVREELKTVRPGLSGIGSIIFRDEEALLGREAGSERFYATVIAPYKGMVECWYIRHQGAVLYLALLLMTVWVVLFPRSRLYRRWLVGLPPAPRELAEL